MARADARQVAISVRGRERTGASHRLATQPAPSCLARQHDREQHAARHSQYRKQWRPQRLAPAARCASTRDPCELSTHSPLLNITRRHPKMTISGSASSTQDARAFGAGDQEVPRRGSVQAWTTGDRRTSRCAAKGESRPVGSTKRTGCERPYERVSHGTRSPDKRRGDRASDSRSFRCRVRRGVSDAAANRRPQVIRGATFGIVLWLMSDLLIPLFQAGPYVVTLQQYPTLRRPRFSSHLRAER
jgi:hypothetical protein